MARILFVVFLLLTAVFGAAPAHAGPVCTADDPALRPLPASLVAEVQLKFGLSNAPAKWVEQATVIRCMGGKTWACNYGADLPCGRADTAATLPAGNDWCRQNPDTGFIPAYITGHNSIWQWRCVNGAPVTAGQPELIDAQGYLAQYWKRLD